MSTTKFSGDQVLQQVYDPATDSLKTNLTANISGAQEVIISSTNDSIAIRNTGNSNELLINADGSINTVGAAVVGGATSAKQDVGNASLASIDSKTPSLGQQLAAASSPVVLTASQISTLTPLSTVAVSNFPVTQPVSIAASVAVTGPLTDTQLRASAVPVSSASLPLPTGASTETTLAALNTKVTTTAAGIKIDGSAVTQPVSGTFFQATQPVSIAASVPVTGPLTDTQLRAVAVPVSGTFFQGTQPVSAASLPLPTSASTSALQTTGNSSLSSIDTKIPALGQALAVASVPIVLTASQLSTLTPLSTVAVTGTFFQGTQPVSGTFFQATQPVSAASLPLPALAATSTKQPALGTAGAASADVITVQGIASMTALKVDGSAVTQPISGTVTVNALTNSSIVKAQLQDNSGTAITVGQKAMASSLPVVLASDQASIPVAATLAAETTKVIGTINVAAAQTIAVTQATGTNLHTVIDSGTISLPALAATSTKQSDGSQKAQLVDGTGAVNGPYTVLSGTTYLPVVLAASTTAGAAIPSKAVMIAGSDGTNGQFILTDTSGRIVVNATPVDGSKATYSASITGLVSAAAGTDLFTITGSATKTIRVTQIIFSGSATAAVDGSILIIKRSTANTGGTSAAAAAIPHDSNSAAASATCLSYTLNPILGTAVGTIRTAKVFLSTSTTQGQYYELRFATRPAQAVVLRGIAQVLAVNFNTATAAGSSLNISVEWTEE